MSIIIIITTETVVQKMAASLVSGRPLRGCGSVDWSGTRAHTHAHTHTHTGTHTHTHVTQYVTHAHKHIDTHARARTHWHTRARRLARAYVRLIFNVIITDIIISYRKLYYCGYNYVLTLLWSLCLHLYKVGMGVYGGEAGVGVR